MGLAAAAGSGWPAEWIGPWAAQDVAYTCAAGVLGGLLMGRLLGWLFFRTRSRALRLSQHRESFIALGGLSALTWRGAITACAVLLVIRSLSGWAGLPRSSLESRERWVVAASGGSARCTTLPTPWANMVSLSRSGSCGQW
ncbi:hypothetical protein [Streptomyces violaceus]|uniref:Cation/H+ exchanger domain-containing protein n=1 Tax=Streptomyces violaceus TaxID=1936 RepID=A0ABZ1P4C8_STRVL